MFNIDDVVVYGTEGICRVTGITEMKFGGEKSEYYILAPVEKEENTVYVPKNNEKILQRMRKILSAEEANHLIASLPMEPMEWIPNDRERQAVYKNIILCGKPEEVFSMVSTLYHKQKAQLAIGKKLHASDERFLREAERMLFNEIGYALNIKPQEVLSMIIKQTRQ